MNWGRVCAQIEDSLVPHLRLDGQERALYYHLLRHSRLCGEPTVLISKRKLAVSSHMGTQSVMLRLRSLARKGCIRVESCGYEGQRVAVRLPEEIPGGTGRRRGRQRFDRWADSLRERDVREAIYARDGWRCFYCQRNVRHPDITIDHVVPRAECGDSSPRNVVTCCPDCNRRKRAMEAADFICLLFAHGRLTRKQMNRRRAALRDLRRGRMKLGMCGGRRAGSARRIAGSSASSTR